MSQPQNSHSYANVSLTRDDLQHSLEAKRKHAQEEEAVVQGENFSYKVEEIQRLKK